MPAAPPVATNPYYWLKNKFAAKKTTIPLEKKNSYPSIGARAYMVSPGQAVWMDRDYSKFAQEAYMRNVVAYRCVNLITQSAAAVRIRAVAKNSKGTQKEIIAHPLLDLLARPNPMTTLSEFLESVYHYRLISGNAFVLGIAPSGESPKELHVLRPDRMAVIAGKNGLPQAYRYTVNSKSKDYPVNAVTGSSAILHVKNFHPLNDWYGLSPVEAAAFSIDQHNHAAAWNQALLQNGARPSGALVVKLSEHSTGQLSEEQYSRIKTQIDEQFSGPANAGRPLLLEGGLDWKEMSMTPKDMDFIECKHSSARDIALAFGVPPQMLGIPGDNTYSNLQEARLSLWEQTIMPLVDSTLGAITEWLAPKFNSDIELKASTENISALAVRNQIIWDRLEKASFLTEDEKRAAVGYAPRYK